MWALGREAFGGGGSTCPPSMLMVQHGPLCSGLALADDVLPAHGSEVQSCAGMREGAWGRGLPCCRGSHQKAEILRAEGLCPGQQGSRHTPTPIPLHRPTCSG